MIINKPLVMSVFLFGMTTVHAAKDDFSDVMSQDAIAPINLATLKFSDGRVINFLEYPAMDELLVEEVVDVGEVLLLQQLKGDLLDKYIRLTPDNTPIPVALVEYELASKEQPWVESEEQLTDGVTDYIDDYFDEVSQQKEIDIRSDKIGTRLVVPAVTEDIFIDLADAELVQTFNLKGAGTGSCNNSSGYLHFESHHCYVSGTEGKGTSKSYCDRAMHGSIQRTSPIKMRTTFSVVANCGTGDAAIVHSKKTWGTYSTVGQRFLGDNKVGSYESAAGKNSIRRYRRVNVLKVTQGGYVRGWTRFHKSVK